ncbi:hypothetical protein PFTANZ_00384 [Plasmodium falciparum Tanzania (2000708)]|nr:hypothetical protein PFTANZ_00384 [Plasmodium falciparum Tanzania (2000708)]
MFIDQGYEKFVTKINNELVHEMDRSYEYINLSYDKEQEKEYVNNYLNNYIDPEKNNEIYFSTNSDTISEVDETNYHEKVNNKSIEQYKNFEKDESLINHQSIENKRNTQNELDDNEQNILNNILKNNNHFFKEKNIYNSQNESYADSPSCSQYMSQNMSQNLSQNMSQNLSQNMSQNLSPIYQNLVEYKYASSTTDIYIKEKNYFSKKKKIKVKKENKMKLFRNINKNDIYNLFHEEICRLCKNKNNHISKTKADDLFFYKSVNKLYHSVNIS